MSFVGQSCFVSTSLLNSIPHPINFKRDDGDTMFLRNICVCLSVRKPTFFYQLYCLTQPIPHSVYFNPEDGDSIFSRKVCVGPRHS
jgi:hypothetical protein